MEARCLKDSCGHEWRLTKPIEEYSQGVRCPECGTTNVDAAQTQTQAQAPARRQPQQQAEPPARQEDVGAVQQGAALGQTLMDLNANDPEKAGQAKGELLKTVGSALAHTGQRLAEEEVEGARRAKQTRDDQIATADTYPRCPECGHQLTNIPAAGEFPCGGCGEVLEVVE